MPSYAFRQYSWRLGPKVQDALAAGGYSLALAGALCLILLLAFRDPARRAQNRILSALTFLPDQQQQRAGADAGSLLSRRRMHPRPKIAGATARLHIAGMDSHRGQQLCTVPGFPGHSRRSDRSTSWCCWLS